MFASELSDTKDTYTKLIELLDQHSAEYSLIDHAEEGRSDLVSALRGHDPSHAAKCMIFKVKVGKKERRYVLGVVPGNEKINFEAIRNLFHGTAVSLAPQELAEELAGSVVGTVLPFSFNQQLILIVDPSLKEHEFIYFNAARLDRSVKLKTSDYLRIADPRFERIVGVEATKMPDFL